MNGCVRARNPNRNRKGSSSRNRRFVRPHFSTIAIPLLSFPSPMCHSHPLLVIPIRLVSFPSPSCHSHPPCVIPVPLLSFPRRRESTPLHKPCAVSPGFSRSIRAGFHPRPRCGWATVYRLDLHVLRLEREQNRLAPHPEQRAFPGGLTPAGAGPELHGFRTVSREHGQRRADFGRNVQSMDAFCNAFRAISACRDRQFGRQLGVR